MQSWHYNFTPTCSENSRSGDHMEGSAPEPVENAVAEVKTVKCSMCRKIKTVDHFFNPNSESLFHVCDYCRFLRKTKYKSSYFDIAVHCLERKVRVELERPVGSLSRTRDGSTSRASKATSQVSVLPKESSDRIISEKSISAGVVPSRRWVDISADASSSFANLERKIISCQTDCRYALNHPYYRYQSLLTSLCNPPQFVYNPEKNRMDIAQSSLPPAPKALIFCCSNPLYGSRFEMCSPILTKKEL